MKLARESSPPPGAFSKLRNTRLYGGRDAQIEGRALSSRGTPNPDRAAVFTRKRPAKSSIDNYVKEHIPQQDCTPRTHKEHVRIAEHNMNVAQARVKAAREAGDEHARLLAANYARELRSQYLELTGGLERRTIDVDQGSAVNPMIAV